MPDYKELLLSLIRSVESTTEILLSALRRAEDLYVQAGEQEQDTCGEPEDKENPN
ncbi:MAG: hypothetical protein RSC51_07930 [Oscillospiraceae bacterium]